VLRSRLLLQLGVAAALLASLASLALSVSRSNRRVPAATVSPAAAYATAKDAAANSKRLVRSSATRSKTKPHSGSTHKATPKGSSKETAKVAKVDGHPISATPYAKGVLLLSDGKKFPVSVLPTVKNSEKLAGKTLAQLTPGCGPETVNLGTWCLEASAYPVPNQDTGKNDYFWASQACVEAGGWLPTAAELIGAAKQVRLESTLTDNPTTAIVDEDAAAGLKDQREMSSSLVTTAAGSSAAGSEGVSEGSTGDPETGEPNPTPEPAVPAPETLQYVTVYSNGTKGGFAGSEPVSDAQNFRCAYAESPGAALQTEE
jgi:hypothetical protein